MELDDLANLEEKTALLLATCHQLQQEIVVLREREVQYLLKTEQLQQSQAQTKAKIKALIHQLTTVDISHDES